jgi:CheY-like chemotaxis protein
LSAVTKLQYVSDAIVKRKIVVIDDDPMTRMVAKKGLNKTYQVHLASNATQAINLCENHIPDIVLLDLMMPNIDGLEVLQLLKGNSLLCDIPVICMSSTDNQDRREQIKLAGASGFIQKPLNPKILSETIETLIQSKSSILHSKHKRISFHISFNELEKDRTMLETMSKSLQGKERIIFISWNRGEDFFEDNPQLLDAIENESLIFLEIKSSLISKFPYLQDITAVVSDIELFIESKSRDYHLFFDEPGNLFNIHNQEKSVSQSYNFAKLIHGNFDKVSYFCSRPYEEKAQKFLNKIAKIITGVNR